VYATRDPCGISGDFPSPFWRYGSFFLAPPPDDHPAFGDGQTRGQRDGGSRKEKTNGGWILRRQANVGRFVEASARAVDAIAGPAFG
jgi:hypothetical protein